MRLLFLSVLLRTWQGKPGIQVLFKNTTHSYFVPRYGEKLAHGQISKNGVVYFLGVSLAGPHGL